MNDRASQTLRKPFTAAEYYDDKGLYYYTGLEDYSNFQLLLDILGPAASKLTYVRGISPPLPVVDQLLLTLMRLRRYTPYFELGRFSCGSQDDGPEYIRVVD